MVDKRLDIVQKDYDEVKIVVSKFLSDADTLVKELRGQIKELERTEERQKQTIRDYESRVDELQEENRSLRQDKKEHGELKKSNERNMQLLDKYSREIDSLKEQNASLQQRCRISEDTLLNERQHIDDLNRQRENYDRLLEQRELDEKVKLANQAADHRKNMTKTTEYFKEALKKLELEISDRDKQIKQQKETIMDRDKKLRMMPHILAGKILKDSNNLQPSSNDFGNKHPIVTSSHSKINPASRMLKEVAGSSISSSTSSSSYSLSRRRNHSVDPYERNKRAR